MLIFFLYHKLDFEIKKNSICLFVFVWCKLLKLLQVSTHYQCIELARRLLIQLFYNSWRARTSNWYQLRYLKYYQVCIAGNKIDRETWYNTIRYKYLIIIDKVKNCRQRTRTRWEINTKAKMFAYPFKIILNVPVKRHYVINVVFGWVSAILTQK